MGYPVSPLWNDALSSPHQLLWLATAVRGGKVLASDIQVDSLTLSASWDGQQITREVKATISDPDSSLFTPDPLSPLAPWGQQLIVRAMLAVGDAWRQIIPIGVFRIEDSGPDGSATMVLQSNGQWWTGGQTLQPTARDMLQQLADEKWTNWVQPHSQTVRDAWARIVKGVDIRLGRWSATTPVPSDMEWGSTKLDAALQLVAIDGRTIWCDRSGLLQLISSTAGTGTTWTYRVGTDVAVSWTPEASRTGLVNGAAVKAETDTGNRFEIWGAAYDRSGPLAWGGPFGRIPDISTSKMVHSTQFANTAAAKKLDALRGSRMANITIEAPANPAIDVLDTASVTLPGGDAMSGLITKVDIDNGSMKLTVQVPWQKAWHD